MNEILWDALRQRQTPYGSAPDPQLLNTIPLPEIIRNSPMGAMAGMAWEQGAANLFEQFGQVPGVFEPRGNIADQFAAREYAANRQQALAQSNAADRQSKLRTIRGIARNAGITFGAEQEAMADVALQKFDDSGLSNIMATMMPETYDALHGPRGSAKVMTSRVHSAGRFQVDPVTGRQGLSGDSAAALTSGMYDRLYGPGADMSANMGLGAGRMGELYDALGRRGELGGGIGTRTAEQQQQLLQQDSNLVQQGLRTLQATDPAKFGQLVDQYKTKTGKDPGQGPADQVKALADTETGSMAAIRALQDSGNPQLEAALRQFDAKRTASQLQSTAKAVSAMRDIFGDSGRMNAPMMELLTEMNALTQGGMVSMAPGEAARMARTSYQIAKDAGISLQDMQGKTSAAGDLAARMGLDRTFGALAAQSGVNFGNAYGQVGGGEHKAFGRQERDKLEAQDTLLTLEAGRSAANNIFGATLRMNDTAEFEQGTEAAALVTALKEGNANAMISVNGEMKHIGDLSPQDFNSIMTNSGVAADTANMTLSETRANQEFGMKTVDLTRQLQARDLANTTLKQGFSAGTVQRLTKLGLSEDEALTASENIGQKMGETLMNMPAADQANKQRRNAILSDKLLTEMAAITQFTPAEQQQVQQLEAGGTETTAARKQVVSKRFTQRELLDAAESGWGQLETAATDRGYESAQNILQLNNKEAVQRAGQQRKETNQKVREKEALATLSQVPLLQRVIAALENPEDDPIQAAGKILGGVDKQEIAATLLPLELEAARAGNAGDMSRLAALKKGGVHAESALKEEAKTRGVELQELLNETERAEKEVEDWKANSNRPAAEIDKLLDGTLRLVAPEEQAKVEAMRPGVAAAKQVRALLTARDHGGTEGLSKAERRLRQVQTLRQIKQDLKKPQDAQDAENKTQVLEGITEGGDVAKRAAADFRKRWEGHEMTPAAQGYLSQLDEAAEHGGLNAWAAELATVKDAEVDQAVASTPEGQKQAAAEAKVRQAEKATEDKKQPKTQPVLSPTVAQRIEDAMGSMAHTVDNANAIDAAIEEFNKDPANVARLREAALTPEELKQAPDDPDKAVRPQGQPGAPEGAKSGTPGRMTITGTVTVHHDGTATLVLNEDPGSTPVAQD